MSRDNKKYQWLQPGDTVVMKRGGEVLCYVKVTHVNDNYAFVRRGVDELRTLWKFDRRIHSDTIRAHNSAQAMKFPARVWRFIGGRWQHIYETFASKLWMLSKSDDDVTLHIASEDELTQFVLSQARGEKENEKLYEYNSKKQARIKRLMEAVHA